jgi:threonine/homoserine/homoserine lactone efflux protein
VTAALLAFTAASILIVLLPGPDTLAVVRGLLRGGRRQSTLTAVGVLSGLAVWVVAAAFGLSAVLRASHAGYTALRVAGAVYLVWLGAQSLRARLLVDSDTVVPPSRRRALLGSGFGAGLATDLLNPKVGVFFVSFLPGFVPTGHSVATMSLLFGAIFITETALYFAVLIGLATRVTAWMTNARIRRRLDRVTGFVLIAFGLRLATET